MWGWRARGRRRARWLAERGRAHADPGLTRAWGRGWLARAREESEKPQVPPTSARTLSRRVSRLDGDGGGGEGDARASAGPGCPAGPTGPPRTPPEGSPERAEEPHSPGRPQHPP